MMCRGYNATRIWRRGWDSNPRLSFPNTRFPSVLLKPLGHLSTRGKLNQTSMKLRPGESLGLSPDTTNRCRPNLKVWFRRAELRFGRIAFVDSRASALE